MREYVTVAEALDDLPDLEAGESSDVPDHEAMNHKKGTVEKLEEIEYGQANHPAYARAPRSRPAFTIVGGHAAAPVHYGAPRRLTVRECLRCQGFPDWYQYEGAVDTRGDKYALTGNAVPVGLAEAVAEAL